MSLDLKHTEASFSPSTIDSLYLRVTEMPRCRDLAIFVRTTDNRQTDCLTPAAHARTRGNNRSERGEMESQNKVSVQVTQNRFITKMKFNDPLLDE
jgi:hypothetical protein